LGESTSGSRWISAAEFYRAPGGFGWRVTGGGTGPQAVFIAASLSHAAGLLAPNVAAAEQFGILTDVDVRPDGIVVRAPSRAPEGTPATAVGFAEAASRVTAERLLTAEPSLVQSIGIYVAQHFQADVRPFFMATPGHEEFGDTDAGDPLRCGPKLAFNPSTADSSDRGRTHFTVHVPAEHAQARVDGALTSGGRLADDSNAPAWWSLASSDNHGVDIASRTDEYKE
jgi:hypothetical protein